MKREDLKGLNIAHRGIHDYKTIENTLDAFRRAVNKNIPVELDIRLTKDNQVVVFHDQSLKRLFGINKDLKDFTYDELNNLNFKNSNSKIPLFSDVLKEVNGKVLILVELKKTNEFGKLSDKTVELLRDYQGDIAFQSFDTRIVAYLKRKYKNYLTGILVSPPSLKRKTYFFEKIFNSKYFVFNVLKVDFVSHSLLGLPSKLTKSAKKRNLPVLVWTIRTKNDYKEALKYGDSFIIDNISSLN